MPVAPDRRARRLWAFAAAGALVLTGAACTSDSGDPSAAPKGSATTIPAGATNSNSAVAAAAALLPLPDPNQVIPPNDVGTLRRLYDPALAKLGLRLTRGALVDRSNGGYEPSNDGTHVALYVEPLDDTYTAADYVDGLWNLAALITPDVFARWSGVHSYDICQEPLPSVDNSAEPLPQTQINLTREVAAGVDWTNGSLPDLLVTARASEDFDLVVSKEIRETPEYKAAAKEAGDRVMAGRTTTTTR